MQAAFVQTSDSAVFGKLTRAGKVSLAKGGHLRVAYGDGLLLVADGGRLIQYDPDTRTAQSMNFHDSAAEIPLLRLLTDPGKLGAAYAVVAQGRDQVHLKPLKQGLPEVRIEGANGLPRRLAWTDPSGAGQVLELKQARVPAQEFPPETFQFQAPKGTRWLGK